MIAVLPIQKREGREVALWRIFYQGRLVEVEVDVLELEASGAVGVQVQYQVGVSKRWVYFYMLERGREWVKVEVYGV